MQIPNGEVDLAYKRQVEIFRVQPGDAAMYSVHVCNGEAVAFVGGADDYWGRVKAGEAAVVSWYSGTVLRPKCSNMYQEEILLYLARVAVGIACEDPRHVYRG